MKRMLSLCLALCMAFALAAPGFAEAADAPLAEAPLAEAAPEGEVIPEAEAPLLLEDVEQAVLDSGEALEDEPLEGAKDAGNSLLSATPINVNTWVNGYNATEYQTDYYRFTLPQDGVVSLTFRHTREDSDRYWEICLGRDNNGSFSSYRVDEVVLREFAETTTYKVGLSAGTYYVKIDGYTNKAPVGRSYSFKVNYTASSQWETESNNSMLDSADPIRTGRTYYGSSLGEWDIDYFRFTVSQRSLVTLTFNHTREDSDRYWYIYLGYDNNGTFSSLAYKKVVLSDGSTSTTVNATLDPGTYYVKIDGRGYNSVSMTYYGPVGREYSFTVSGPDDVAQIRAFATRLYDKCLGRKPDGGIETWIDVLYNKSWTAERAAWGFVFSKEYTNKHTSNDAYVRMLYLVYMDREADASGYNTWINALNSGWSREQVMQGFSRSVEFKNICARYGMTPW